MLKLLEALQHAGVEIFPEPNVPLAGKERLIDAVAGNAVVVIDAIDPVTKDRGIDRDELCLFLDDVAVGVDVDEERLGDGWV